MAAFSGQKTVSSAGTAEPLVATETRANGSLFIKALPSNTGTVYVGNDGAADVSSTTGLALSAGDLIAFEYIGDLRSIYVDAAVNGEGVSWLMGKAM